ncbi:MAG: hypothetical protein HOU81_04995 [Hamadaea sp.]|uniref:hypothetical protein n=1 Tax=Hamadaea sp. TaxID=2024425 RepID=UPI00182C97AF|nr:hypothetical protein [Hamadaea sp.]NUR70153.1 hypothetical protein [Hamadaea sp.]NUT23533.1 hypothetical protein [Hamadaea sp.]
MRPPQPPPHRRIRWFDRYRRAVLAGGITLVVIGVIGVAYAVQRPDDDTGADTGASASGPASSGAGSDPSSASATPAPSASSSLSATATPKPSPSSAVPPAAGGPWPNAANTGVPSGTKLTTYTGPCTITSAGTVIDAKTVNCDSLDIRAANVTIKRSKINGAVSLDTDASGSSKWSYTLVDSEVDAGLRQYPAVSYGNMKVIRTEVRGGGASVQCGEHAISCTVEDSWLHSQLIPDNANWHLDGFLSNGGRNIRIRHNTIACDPPTAPPGEGCTADLALLGDFGPITDVVIDSNYFPWSKTSSYCLYGGDAPSKPYPRATYVVITNNVFQRGPNRKCAAYGAVTGFNVNGTGNRWANNKWDDGSPVPPQN